MMTNKEINSWIDFISSFDVDYSCTVMFERRFSRRKRTMRFRDEVIKFLKIFMTQLNVHFYGTKSTKKSYEGERLLIIPVIEHWNSDDKDLHFHFFIGNVPVTDIDDISLRVKHSWSKVPRSEKKENSILIEKTWYKGGWSSYIIKELRFKNIDCVLTDLIQTTC